MKTMTKKDPGYLARAQADYKRIAGELEAARTELAEAEAELAIKERAREEAERAAPRYGMSPAEREAKLAASSASNRVTAARHVVSDLADLHRDIGRIAQAPEHHRQARVELDALLERAKAVEKASGEAAAAVGKLEKRIAELEDHIAAEMQSAAAALLDADGDFTAPQSLTTLEAALRLVKSTLAGLRTQKDGLEAEGEDLREAVRDARSRFRSSRATIADIEARERLESLMPLLARASAARSEVEHHHEAHRFSIDIPQPLLDEARTALEAELAGA